MDQDYPILEFDTAREAFIEPEQLVQPCDVPEACVLCYFGEAIERLLADRQYMAVNTFRSEGIDLPVYVVDYNGTRVGLLQACVGAPLAAAQLEELTAMGFSEYIVCGACGVLKDDIAAGRFIIPTTAVRDEGTSYHYAPPTREMIADRHAVAVIESVLTANRVPYVKGKVWTTDAFYRETPDKVARRRADGCITVDMEASALMAVAQFRGVTLGAIHYAGDSLAGQQWDHREYNTRFDVRARLLTLALEAAIAL